jgi:hypothetical protein
MCRHLSACRLQSRASVMARTCRRRGVLATPPRQDDPSTCHAYGRNRTCHRGSVRWHLRVLRGPAIHTSSERRAEVFSHQRRGLRSREEPRQRSQWRCGKARTNEPCSLVCSLDGGKQVRLNVPPDSVWSMLAPIRLERVTNRTPESATRPSPPSRPLAIRPDTPARGGQDGARRSIISGLMFSARHAHRPSRAAAARGRALQDFLE